jgi:hypothetical protein
MWERGRLKPRPLCALLAHSLEPAQAGFVDAQHPFGAASAASRRGQFRHLKKV